MSCKTHLRLTLVLTTLVALQLCTNSSEAGILASTPHAFSGTVNPLPSGPTWKGSSVLSNFFGSATLDWAVFDAAGYQAFIDEPANNITTTNPVGANELLYAYQFSNITTTFGSNSGLTVGLDGDEIISGITAPDPTFLSAAEFPGADRYPFNQSNQGGTSMAWEWTQAASGEETTILYFLSPQLPELDWASALMGPQIAQVADMIGSPSNLPIIPEPTSATIALALVAVVLGGRKRRLV